MTALTGEPTRSSLARAAERGQTGRVKLEVIRIAQDGGIRRQMIDTSGRSDADRWEELISQVPAFPPPYRAAPGDTVYQISVGERTVMVAEDDLTGPLRELVMAVLAEGDGP